ncbi:hypothetical protein DFQ28_000492 [Apophysomyces sp. BC1034]|nr:hypothetical protein DFQ30_000893 [Apophysomyces sp. BC1015]KAG0167656.1 hypothetical protein DFQ29_000332 [Apophysomyces sp. BC1021]KAG0183916.1 hypothetical protein DFQ28_000492 [Apophysomyces sp. BC1034]
MAQPVRFQSLTNPLVELASADTRKNAADLLCPRDACRSVIFRKNTATLVKRDGNKITLPKSVLPEGADLLDTDENITDFWCLTSMMDFDNIGFSKPVGSIKFLSCADCDIGPIGYHDTASKPEEFLISIRRVRYRF